MIAIAIRTTSVSVKLAETETMWNYCETVVEWSMLQEIDEAAVAVHCRQGPRISIRIDIWILPSDTIRG